MEAKIKELDEEEGRAKSTEVQFTSKQKKDYQRLKQQASAVTAGLKAAEAACQAKKRTLERRLENVRSIQINMKRLNHITMSKHI